MSYKSFLNIDKESFDSLFDQLSLSDGLILYYNADKLDSVSGYNYE